MILYIVFGLPGVGKTFVGKMFEEFGFYYYDGDTDLTDEMKEAIPLKKVFTDDMRDRFFARLIDKIQLVSLAYDKLVVSQMFIKEKYRRLLLERIPDAKFVLVTAPTDVRENRLLKRKEYPLDLEYSRIMVRNFEEPKIKHAMIENSVEGKEVVRKQIKELLNTYIVA